MKLGDCALSFEDGKWVVGKCITQYQFASRHELNYLPPPPPPPPHLSVGGKGGSKEYVRLQKQSTKLQEENNLLKYKIELLLDMLAASNADCIVLQKELDALKKAKSQR